MYDKNDNIKGVSATRFDGLPKNVALQGMKQKFDGNESCLEPSRSFGFTTKVNQDDILKKIFEED